MMDTVEKQRDGMHEVWLLFLGSGIVMVLLGAVLVAFSVFTSVAVLLFMGCMLIVSSVIQLTNSCWARRWKGFSTGIFLGIIYLIMGCLIIEHPLQATLTITLVIAAGMMIAGAVRSILSLTEKWDGWKLTLLSGAVTFALGFCIWLETPTIGLWLIGSFIGIELLLNGCTWIRLGISLHRIQPVHD